MKLKYIFTSLAAVCALAGGCTKTYPTELENIQVSQSTIGLDADAERVVKVDFTTNSEWKIETEIPSWLSVTPVSGPAGKTVVEFKAAAASKSCNKATLKVSCGGQTQYVYVQQGKGAAINTPETAFTVDETIDFFKKGNKGAEVYVKGTVKSASISTAYGNAEFYLENTKGIQFEFYRCLDLEGEKFTDDKKVQVGDVIVGYGTLTNWGETVELDEGCKLISITKSLVKLLDSGTLNVGKEGDVVSVRVIRSGDNLDIQPEVPWITVASIQTLKGKKNESFGTYDADTTVVNLSVGKNVDDVRTGVVNFTSASGSQATTIGVTVIQDSGLDCYSLPYEEKFEQNMGAWTVSDVKGIASADVWSFDAANKCMKASGFVGGSSNEAESDLVSPRLDLTDVAAASLTFEHAAKYGASLEDEFTLWVSTDNGGTYAQILIPEYTKKEDWNYVSNTVSLTPYVGNQVLVKFKYKSYLTGGPTVNLRNVSIKAEEAGVLANPVGSQL